MLGSKFDKNPDKLSKIDIFWWKTTKTRLIVNSSTHRKTLLRNNFAYDWQFCCHFCSRWCLSICKSKTALLSKSFPQFFCNMSNNKQHFLTIFDKGHFFLDNLFNIARFLDVMCGISYTFQFFGLPLMKEMIFQNLWNELLWLVMNMSVRGSDLKEMTFLLLIFSSFFVIYSLVEGKLQCQIHVTENKFILIYFFIGHFQKIWLQYLHEGFSTSWTRPLQ